MTDAKDIILKEFQPLALKDKLSQGEDFIVKKIHELPLSESYEYLQEFKGVVNIYAEQNPDSTYRVDALLNHISTEFMKRFSELEKRGEVTEADRSLYTKIDRESPMTKLLVSFFNISDNINKKETNSEIKNIKKKEDKPLTLSVLVKPQNYIFFKKMNLDMDQWVILLKKYIRKSDLHEFSTLKSKHSKIMKMLRWCELDDSDYAGFLTVYIMDRVQGLESLSLAYIEFIEKIYLILAERIDDFQPLHQSFQIIVKKLSV